MKLLPQLRAAAQQSSARAAGRMAHQGPKLTTNRMKIVSVENNSPMTKLTLFVRAGSRHETGFNLGVSHCLRSAAGLATKRKTAIAFTRTVQQLGASLTATGTKEHIIYSIEADRSKADAALDCLLEAVLQPEFHSWEIGALKQHMELDLALHKQNDEEQLIGRLHKAAFRSTVGRSLYAPEFMLGKFEAKQLHNYTEAHCTPERMALVGVGCPHNWLEGRATSIIKAPSPAVRHFPVGNKPAEAGGSGKHTAVAPNDEAATYYGGQSRLETDSNLALIAVAGEGVPIGSKQMPAAFVLQRIFGAGPRLKWSASQTHGRLAKAVASALPSGSLFAVSGLNYKYSDCGLFGFCLAVQPDMAGHAARAAVLENAKIANGSLTEADVTVAKQQAKADLLFAMERDANYTEALAQAALVTGEVLPSAAQLVAQIDAVTVNDVLQVAKRAAGSRTSMAAVGDLSDTPYLEEIIA